MTNLGTVFGRWRQIEGESYSTGGDRFNPPALDCSGGIIYANRTVVPWLNTGYGNSASIAQYAVDHGLVIPLRSRMPGSLVIYDKYGQATQSNGNRGHIGQVSDDINVTWECASSRGCQRYDYHRLGWCMCVDMRHWLGATSTPGGDTPPDQGDEFLANVSDAEWNIVKGQIAGALQGVQRLEQHVGILEGKVDNGNGVLQTQVANVLVDPKIGLQRVTLRLADAIGAIKAKLGA